MSMVQVYENDWCASEAIRGQVCPEQVKWTWHSERQWDWEDRQSPGLMTESSTDGEKDRPADDFVSHAYTRIYQSARKQWKEDKKQPVHGFRQNAPRRLDWDGGRLECGWILCYERGCGGKQRGGHQARWDFWGRCQREEVKRNATYSELRNHLSVARRSERAAMASA